MDSFFTMLRLQSMLLIFLLVGIFMRKRKMVPTEARPYFTDFLVRIALPCMIFHSFRSDSGWETLYRASGALWISSFVCGVSFLAGWLLYRNTPAGRRSVMRYGTLVSNAGFAGLPQVNGMYGAAGLLYASIYLIPLRISMWSGGISLFIRADRRTKVKSVLTNPGMIAVFLGIPYMLLPVALPRPVEAAIQAIGDCTNPLSMIIIGMIVADIPIKTVICRDVLLLTTVRLVVLPGLVLLVLKSLHMDPMLIGVSVLLTAMPVGVNTPILAQKYGGDHEFASKCVLLSTVLSLFTLPIISVFLS